MAGFVRRFRFVPPLSQILEIEGAVIVDLTPPAPITGAGTGTVLVVGEFEDGPFGNVPLNAEGTSGIQEAFGSQDLEQRWGSFGYTYNGVTAQNPSARIGDGELWNGNAFLKLFGLRANRLLIGRADTSVGEVSFSPLACITSTRSLPTVLSPGDLVTFTSDIGGPASSDVIAATAATVVGAAGTFPTGFTGGETITITVNLTTKNIVFSAADQTNIQVIAKINAVMGFTLAVDSAGEIDFINSLTLGTGSFVTLADVTPGILAILGHSAGTTNGTGNVANSSAVTNAEVAAIINASAALGAIAVSAVVTSTGELRVCSDTPGGAGTLLSTVTTMSTALEIPVNLVATTAIPATGGTIPAGTRVRTAGALEWVTMQTLDIPAGEVGPYIVKVRPGLDDGTEVGTAAGTVVVVFDQPDFANLTVSNPAALTAALTDPQKDAAYSAVLAQSLAEDNPSAQANYLLLARRTDGLVLAGRANTVDAEGAGLFGRKYITGSKLGTSPTASITEVANFRSDRVFYTALGLRVTIPQIATVGTAGGLGFTADGIITVRPDGPLTTADATLPPEENPGQALNGLIDQFFEVDTFGNTVDINTYEAFKANGISAPRLDRQSGMIFQSGVTSSITPGLVTQARRKMADFIQDSLAQFLPPFAKKLNKQTQRDAIRAAVENFLAGLESANAPELQRIESFSVDDSINAGNTPTTLAQGVYFLLIKVRTLSSLDDIVAITEIGENVVTTTVEVDAAA